MYSIEGSDEKRRKRILTHFEEFRSGSSHKYVKQKKYFKTFQNLEIFRF